MMEFYKRFPMMDYEITDVLVVPIDSWIFAHPYPIHFISFCRALKIVFKHANANKGKYDEEKFASTYTDWYKNRFIRKVGSL